jgi:hypothetical protein
MRTPTTTAPEVIVDGDRTGYTQQIESSAPPLLADEPISSGIYTGPGSYDLRGIGSSH